MNGNTHKLKHHSNWREDDQEESKSCTCWEGFTKCRQKVDGKSWNVDETRGVIELELNSFEACARACDYSPDGTKLF